MFPAAMTMGKFRELTKEVSDDASLEFMYREDLMNDDGVDALFTPTTLWLNVDEDKKPTGVVLVSIIPPEVLGGSCGCGDDCDCEEDCGEDCECGEGEDIDPSKLN